MITIGETLGPYIIEALLAQGGMGAVFRARNRVTGHLRALKVVRPDLVKEQDFAERFVREVTIASQVRHPNLVETLEPGIDGDIIYLPMELLIGETLAARLKRVQRFSSAETAAILVPITEAMQALHDRGLVHRDLKPMNVFLARVDNRDVPKVIDLGTARDADDTEHTRTGLVVGSPYYMAVEQAEGRKDIDGRADQYALGVIAYQMLTGARPYESDDTRSALAKLLRGEPYVPPSRVFPGITGPVEQVVGRALAHDRNQRFARIADFGGAFAAAVQGQTGQGLPGGGAGLVAAAAPQITAAGHGLGHGQMMLSTATLMAPEGAENPLEAAMAQARAIAEAQGGAQPNGFAQSPPSHQGPPSQQGGFAPQAGPPGAMQQPPPNATGGFAPTPGFAAAPSGFAAPPTAAPATSGGGRSKIVWALFALAVLGAISVAGVWFVTRPTIAAVALDPSHPTTPVGAPPVPPVPPPVLPPVVPPVPPVVPPPVATPPIVPPLPPPVATPTPPVVPPVPPPVVPPVPPPVVPPPTVAHTTPPPTTPPSTTTTSHTSTTPPSTTSTTTHTTTPPSTTSTTTHTTTPPSTTTHTTTPTPTPTPTGPVRTPPPSTTTTPTPTGPVRTPPPSTTTTTPTPTPTPRHSDSETSSSHHGRHSTTSAPCGAATGIPCLD